MRGDALIFQHRPRRVCQGAETSERGTEMEHDSEARHRLCGGLLGWGDDDGRQYMVEPDAAEAALQPRTRDRLQHMDELNHEALEPYVATQRVSRRRVVGVGGILGLLASVAPTSLIAACSSLRGGGAV